MRVCVFVFWLHTEFAILIEHRRRHNKFRLSFFFKEKCPNKFDSKCYRVRAKVWSAVIVERPSQNKRDGEGSRITSVYRPIVRDWPTYSRWLWVSDDSNRRIKKKNTFHLTRKVTSNSRFDRLSARTQHWRKSGRAPRLGAVLFQRWRVTVSWTNPKHVTRRMFFIHLFFKSGTHLQNDEEPLYNVTVWTK